MIFCKIIVEEEKKVGNEFCMTILTIINLDINFLGLNCLCL